MTTKNITVFEAFAGIGAQMEAMNNLMRNDDLLKQLGLVKEKVKFVNVGTSEWFIDAIISYDALHHGVQTTFPKYEKLSNKVMLKFLLKYTLSKDSKTPCSKQEIKKLSFEKIRQIYIAIKRNKNFGSIVDIKPENLPQSDIFTYSFPCQNLSTIGKGEGLEVGTKSGLLWEIQRILYGLKLLKRLPKFLVMENVKALFSKKHISGWNKFASFLESLGYKNTTMVLNAKNFGTPQNRERAFCISELNGTDEIIVESKGSHTNIHDFLDLNNDDLIEEYKAAMPNNTPSRIKWIEKSKHLNDMTHCMTITTKTDRFPNPGMFFSDINGKLVDNVSNDWNINGDKAPFRFLTPREQLQLMAFKSNAYDVLKNIGMSKTKIQLMAGNSIVVSKLEAIFTSILKRIVSKKIKVKKDILKAVNNTEYFVQLSNVA
ncbi:MAG: DNA (cytosine-5-)-methyltransferase [Arcobacter sp.]|uniref:DNA (cytosine-5-)-methyltransferase n=1 Tax=Arcobacter sp. TaxID=1872629 RepID=UPI003D06D8FC